MPRLRSWLLAPALSGSGSVPGARAGAGCGSGSRARTRSQASQRPENLKVPEQFEAAGEGCCLKLVSVCRKFEMVTIAVIPGL
uniref:MRPL21 n=1 Tax=Bursaphelenchus xylophilus TaxID=6326 RepID=A0A1I7RM03_BURXY